MRSKFTLDRIINRKVYSSKIFGLEIIHMKKKIRSMSNKNLVLIPQCGGLFDF